MIDFRNAIRAELHRRGWSTYRLIKEIGGNPAPVYRFMAGKGSVRTKTLARILGALGLEIGRR